MKQCLTFDFMISSEDPFYIKLDEQFSYVGDCFLCLRDLGRNSLIAFQFSLD